MSNRKNHKIILTGGGTGGSVAPLLAVADELKLNFSSDNDRFEFLWLGGDAGPEKEMATKADLAFKAVSSGKLRRYFSWRNLIDPFLIIVGFFQSIFIIKKWRAELVVSAGSFISVPVVWASRLLGVSVLIHQQDVRPGLANKLMAPAAKTVTVSFSQSVADFGAKAVFTGNPIQRQISELQIEKGVFFDIFKIEAGVPVVLVVGGGTGSQALNLLVEKALSELVKFCQIIHLTGEGKKNDFVFLHPRYKFFEFLSSTQMAAVYGIAEIVVSRCGMGVLTELAFLAKPAILIPLPGTHQEDNAELFFRHQAAVVLDQNQLTREIFIRQINSLLANRELQKKLSENISRLMRPDGARNIAEVILKLL